eukprot:g8015.t1
MQERTHSRLSEVSQFIWQAGEKSTSVEQSPEYKKFVSRLHIEESKKKSLEGTDIKTQRLRVGFEGRDAAMRAVHNLYKGYRAPVWTRWMTVIQAIGQYCACCAFWLGRVFVGLGTSVKFGADHVLEHDFQVDMSASMAVQFVFVVTCWFVMIIIGPIEHYNAELLKYKPGELWRAELREQFEADFTKAMRYLMNHDEVMNDMAFLFCSIGLDQTVKFSEQQIFLIAFHRRVAQIALLFSKAAILWRDGIGDAGDQWLCQFGDAPTPEVMQQLHAEPVALIQGDPSTIGLECFRQWGLAQPERRRFGRVKRAATFLLGRDRTTKLCERKVGRFKKEGHKYRTGLKSTAGTDAAVARKDWQDARARRDDELAESRLSAGETSESASEDERPAKRQYTLTRAIDLKRRDQYNHGADSGGQKAILERTHALNKWKDTQERIKYERMADVEVKKKPLVDRVEPPPPKDGKQKKSRPLVLVENERQFYEEAEKETAGRYCEGRGGDYRVTLPNRCNRVAQPIANEKPPAITLKKVQEPVSAVLLGRWCRAQRKRLKTLRAEAALAAGMGAAEAEALLAEDEQGDQDGQEVGEDEPEPEEESRPIKEYLEKVKDLGSVLSPVLITTFKHKNSEKEDPVYIADVMLNPTRFKGMVLHRMRQEEFQKELEEYRFEGAFFWSDDTASPYDFDTVRDFYLPQLAQESLANKVTVKLGDKIDLCAKKAPPKPKPAKEVPRNENYSSLSLWERDTIRHTVSETLLPVYSGVVAPRAQDKIFVLSTNLKVAFPVQAGDASEEQKAAFQAAGGKAGAGASADGGAQAGSAAAGRGDGIQNDDAVGGAKEQGLEGGAALAGEAAPQKDKGEKIVLGAMEYRVHQQGRLKIQNQLAPLRIGGFKCAEASSADTLKRHGRDSDRLKVTCLDKTIKKTLRILLDAPHVDMHSKAKKSTDKIKQFPEKEGPLWTEAVLNLWSIRARFIGERALQHTKNFEHFPGEGREKDLRAQYEAYVKEVQDWATLRAGEDKAKVNTIEDWLKIDDKTLSCLQPDVEGAAWTDFPGEELSEPEGE